MKEENKIYEFEISKTSEFESKIPPHQLAIKKRVPNLHVRSCTEEYFNNKFSDREGLWRSKGTNHTIPKPGCIQRQQGFKNIWVVKFTTISDFMSFVSEIPHPIILTDDSIEIYDDYRE